MERVAFLIEDTGERLSCLLNPNTVLMRRAAGVRPRRSASGELTGSGMADTPLLFTGGGITELELELLFDVNVVGSQIATDDVRMLTRPFWELAENVESGTRAPAHSKLRVVRFVWGKSWDIPGVVTAVAERVEYFTDGGAPQRSWMRVRLVRVTENLVTLSSPLSYTIGESPPSVAPTSTTPTAPMPPINPEAIEALRSQPPERMRTHELLSAEPGAGEGGRSTQRLDEISQRYYQRPDLWRVIAATNDISDPLHLPTGAVLRIPQL